MLAWQPFTTEDFIHLACSGRQSQTRILSMLPTRSTSHVITSSKVLFLFSELAKYKLLMHVVTFHFFGAKICEFFNTTAADEGESKPFKKKCFVQLSDIFSL